MYLWLCVKGCFNLRIYGKYWKVMRNQWPDVPAKVLETYMVLRCFNHHLYRLPVDFPSDQVYRSSTCYTPISCRVHQSTGTFPLIKVRLKLGMQFKNMWFFKTAHTFIYIYTYNAMYRGVWEIMRYLSVINRSDSLSSSFTCRQRLVQCDDPPGTFTKKKTCRPCQG